MRSGRAAVPWAAALALTAAAAPCAHAAALYELSGFGTLGHARVGSDGPEYRTGIAQDGADSDGSLEPDSRFGLQLDAELTPVLGGAVQLLAREGADGEVEAGLERAFVRVALGDWAGVRFGRLALPVFARSEYRYVGYANVPVRPPEEVYALLPFGRYDGVDLIVQREIGDALLEGQLYVGESHETIYGDLRVDTDLSRGAAATLERGPLKLRAGWLAIRASFDQPGLTALFDAVEGVPAGLPGRRATLDALSSEPRDVSYASAGLTLDLEPVVVEAEYARRRVSPHGSFAPDAHGWYVSLARRFGRLTPYGFVASFDEDKPPLPLALPAGAPGAAELDAALTSAFPELDQRTAGLGLRWDPAPGIAFKLQVERVRRETFGISLARGAVPEDDPGDDVTLFSTTLDVVF